MIFEYKLIWLHCHLPMAILTLTKESMWLAGRVEVVLRISQQVYFGESF